jgi:hypothetical protein
VSLRFQAIASPSVPLLKAVAELDANNPFATPEYAEARTALGERSLVLGLEENGRMVVGCLAFIQGKLLRRRLQLPSLPELPQRGVFWRGIWHACRQRNIWQLQVDTYASLVADIPLLEGETSRRDRFEYILHLDSDVLNVPSSNHRRNITRAQRHGVSIRRTHHTADCKVHAKLMASSMRRRSARGEQVTIEHDTSVAEALLVSGAGELFQAIHQGEVAASMLVLRSRKGGYYHSAGTSSEGMEMGASPFLLSEVAEILKREGAEIFNLGGAEPSNPGLQRFKLGFGAREVSLAAASFCPGSPIRRKVRHTLRLVRNFAMMMVA